MENRVEELRKARGLNQEEFARAILVSRQTVSSIETGKYNPSLELALRSQTSLGWLLRRSLYMKGAFPMKKSNLWWALGTTAVGVMLFLAGLVWENRLSAILCGIGGGWVFNGLAQLWRYVKWTRPENAQAYRRRIEQEQIDLHDERKEMLRNKSGRYAYVLGLILCCLSVLIFSILHILGALKDGLVFVLFLTGYLIVQYAAGILIYRRLEQKC